MAKKLSKKTPAAKKPSKAKVTKPGKEDIKEKPAAKATKEKPVSKPDKAVSKNVVEQDILKVVGAKGQAKDEEFQAYAMRLAEAIEDDDKAWDKMSEAAQEWFSEAAEASQKKKPLPEFPDNPEGAGDSAKEEPPAAKKSAKSAKAEKPAKAAKEPKAKKEKAPKEPRTPRDSASGKVLKLVCKDLDADTATILERARKGGVTGSDFQVRQVCNFAHRVVRELREVGAMK
jgi:hypothetical protein